VPRFKRHLGSNSSIAQIVTIRGAHNLLRYSTGYVPSLLRSEGCSDFIFNSKLDCQPMRQGGGSVHVNNTAIEESIIFG
jgi:hypothetical protein